MPVVNLMSGTFKPTLLNSTLKLGLCEVTQLPLKKDTAGKLEAWEKKTGFAPCWLLICFLCSRNDSQPWQQQFLSAATAEPVQLFSHLQKQVLDTSTRQLTPSSEV